jgi:homoserine acetyltransferase
MDMIRAQRILLEQEFQLPYLHASVGASMGGMQSLAMAQMYPGFVRKCVSISACARSHPYSIAMRSVQRVVLMNDPNWRRGYYYPEFTEPDEPTPRIPPHTGMKLARMISTIGYRSGPEWESRFGRKKMSDEEREQERQRLGVQHPYFCPEFLVETYLENQGEKFRLQYDANSLLYVSKAMDMFDLSLSESDELPKESTDVEYIAKHVPPVYDTNVGASSVQRDLARGLSRIQADTLVLGVQSDILFPITQQKEIADHLRECKKARTTYYELDSIFGHDTFLVDVTNTGAAVKGHLERDCT